MRARESDSIRKKMKERHRQRDRIKKIDKHQQPIGKKVEKRELKREMYIIGMKRE